MLFAGKVLIPRIVKQGIDGIAFDRLALKKHLGHKIKLLTALTQDALCTLMGLAHDALDLGVNAASRLLGIILMVGIVTAQEHLMLSLAKHLSTQFLAHAQTRNHLAGHLRCALKVVRCARGDVVAHELLGNATAQEYGELIEHLVFGLEEVILGGQLHGITKRLASRDD